MEGRRVTRGSVLQHATSSALAQEDDKLMQPRGLPTGAPFQNPRSRNYCPPNKSNPTLFVSNWGGVILFDPNSANAGFRMEPPWAAFLRSK